MRSLRRCVEGKEVGEVDDGAYHFEGGGWVAGFG